MSKCPFAEDATTAPSNCPISQPFSRFNIVNEISGAVHLKLFLWLFLSVVANAVMFALIMATK